MTDTGPLDDRGPDEPHPSRLAPDHPMRAAIVEAHRAARESGLTGYTDPATGYLVMTSAYLAGRGTCCAQGCRHCPFIH
jgi:hypothetical protein